MVYKSAQALPHHAPTFQTSTKQFLPVRNECVYATAALCNVWTSFCSRTRCSTTHPHPYLALDRLRIHVKLCEYFEGFDMTSIWERPRQHLQAAEHRMGRTGKAALQPLMIPSPTVPWGYSPSAVRYVAGRTHVAGGNAGQWRRQPGCTNDSTARPSSLPGQRARCSANKSRS